MSNDECTEWMRFNISANDYSFSLPFGINEQMLCTKGILDEESGIYSGPCPGDSGGPLYINGEIDDTSGELTGQTIVGIHSGALGCGFRNAPAWWQRVCHSLKHFHLSICCHYFRCQASLHGSNVLKKTQ